MNGPETSFTIYGQCFAGYLVRRWTTSRMSGQRGGIRILLYTLKDGDDFARDRPVEHDGGQASDRHVLHSTVAGYAYHACGSVSRARNPHVSLLLGASWGYPDPFHGLEAVIRRSSGQGNGGGVVVNRGHGHRIDR